MRIVAGMIAHSSAGFATLRPSIAESTEIDGVMIPSPNRSPAPAIASSDMISRPRRASAERPRGMSESSAKMPPSPRFDARVITKMYLMLTTKTTSQKTSDRSPRT
jgi:hypothetical protein